MRMKLLKSIITIPPQNKTMKKKEERIKQDGWGFEYQPGVTYGYRRWREKDGKTCDDSLRRSTHEAEDAQGPHPSPTVDAKETGADPGRLNKHKAITSRRRKTHEAAPSPTD